MALSQCKFFVKLPPINCNFSYSHNDWFSLLCHNFHFFHLSRVVGSTLLIGFLGYKLQVYLLRLRTNYTCVLFQSSLNTSTLLWCFTIHSPLLPIDIISVWQNHSLGFAEFIIEFILLSAGRDTGRIDCECSAWSVWNCTKPSGECSFSRNYVWVCGWLRQVSNVTNITLSFEKALWLQSCQLAYLLYHYCEMYWCRMYLREIHRLVVDVLII